MSANLQTVIKFLLGEGPLDGFYFGDSDTARPKARYWWRDELRQAMAVQPAGRWTLKPTGTRGVMCEVFDADGKRIAEGYKLECSMLVDAHNAGLPPAQPVAPSDDVMAAAWAVVQDAIDGRRSQVHPCDRENNDLAVRACSSEIQVLYAALTQRPSAAPSAQIADDHAGDEPVAHLRAVEPDEIPDWPWPFMFVDGAANEAILNLVGAFPVYRATQPPTAPVLDERAKFEAAYIARVKARDPLRKYGDEDIAMYLARNSSDESRYLHAQEAWEGWQARAAQQAATCQPAATDAKHCPFCGNVDEVYHGATTYCDNCGADGPSYFRDGKPVAKWSDRAAPTCQGGAQQACTQPPTGWRCTREAGHDGPCAAVPTDPSDELHEYVKRTLPEVYLKILRGENHE